MTKLDRLEFIKRLERARAAVVRGDTGCSTAPTKCWRCAMRYHSGAGGEGFVFDNFTGPNVDWSLKRPKSHTLAMFDNSIAALR